MKIKTHKMQQGSQEWFEAKLGIPGASRSSVIDYKEPTYYADSNKAKAGQIKHQGGWTDGAITYAYQLIAERLTGEVEHIFVNDAMQRGIDLEPEARAVYEQSQKVEVVEVGGLSNDWAWYSPDGLVEDSGLIEIKCPGAKRHLRTKLTGVIPSDNMDQLIYALWLSGRQWIDFVSWNPDFADNLKAARIRLEREQVLDEIARLQHIMPKFWQLLNVMETKAKGL